MDNSSNHGIQIFGEGKLTVDNLAVGHKARAIKKTQVPTSAPEQKRLNDEPTEPSRPKPSRPKVFISYSRKDVKWLEQLQVHLKPLEQRGMIELWDDSQIAAGERWKKELEVAIQSSTIALMLVSANFLASDFISEYELPKLLSQAESGGTTILPVIVSPCLIAGSGIDPFRSINPPDKPLSTMKPSVREQIFVKLAETITKKL
jgi:hypothetical protein